MVLVFDVDDTLYDEATFVVSGFRAVSRHLQAEFGIAPAKSLRTMRELLQRNGRGAIFDDLLAAHGIRSKSVVRACLGVYRAHQPKISLYPDARQFLVRCLASGEQPLYVVTDGNALVQERKVRALGLSRWVRHAFVTARYGEPKPSAHCFIKICEREGVEPNELVYFGDNPRKDFVGIKPLGMRTVRLMRGCHREVEMPATYEAEFRVASFREVDASLLKQLKKGARVHG